MMELKVTTAQIRKIHTMLGKIGYDSKDKEDLIARLTSNRTTSTKELTRSEAKYLIDLLSGKNEQKDERAINILRSIYKMACDLGMCYGDTWEDRQMNIAKINMFCRDKGIVKKNITAQNLTELRKTQKQFFAMCRNNNNKKQSK